VLALALAPLQAPAPAAATEKAALEALKKSCDKGAFADCFKLATQYARGEGAPRDLDKASGFYKKACEGKVAQACFDFAALLRGGAEKVKKDVPRAVLLYEQACDGGVAQGCAVLGEMYESGKEVEMHLGKAGEFHERACTEGMSASCGALGVMYAEGNRRPKD